MLCRLFQSHCNVKNDKSNWNYVCSCFLEPPQGFLNGILRRILIKLLTFLATLPTAIKSKHLFRNRVKLSLLAGSLYLAAWFHSFANISFTVLCKSHPIFQAYKYFKSYIFSHGHLLSLAMVHFTSDKHQMSLHKFLSCQFKRSRQMYRSKMHQMVMAAGHVEKALVGHIWSCHRVFGCEEDMSFNTG